MKNRTAPILIGVTICIVLLIGGILFFMRQTPTQSEKDKAIDLAKQLYGEKKAEGMDFSDGPCLSNNLMPDWVLDIAHNPRQPVDDLPQNQCPAFREGKAHHFVELDPNGNLIRIY